MLMIDTYHSKSYDCTDLHCLHKGGYMMLSKKEHTWK